MFHYLYEWAQDLAVYLILVTAVLHALPDSGYKKYIRFFTGLVLTLMMLTPALKILGADGQIMNFYKSREYEKKIEEIEKASLYLEEYQSSHEIADMYRTADMDNMTDINGTADNEGKNSARNIGKIEVEEIQTNEDR